MRLMDGDLTVLETVDRAAVGDIRTRIRDILGAFLFRGEDVDKKVRCFREENDPGWPWPGCYFSLLIS